MPLLDADGTAVDDDAPTRARHRLSIPCESSRGVRRRPALVLAAMLACSPGVQSGTPVSCGLSISPGAAAQRLSELRLHGALCPSGAMAAAAPVVWNDRLADAAQVQAREMARLGRMSHRDSQDRGLGERLRAASYPFRGAVENVAVGFASIDDVVEAWLESEGHCENLMNAAVREFGLACVDTDAKGAPEERRYWALVLGAPRPR
ncbi:MAG: CAP domain-containing protein [Caldimonas sp.]